MNQPAAVAWQYVVRLLPPEDLPMAAAHLLAAGYDSPSLRDLAGRSRREDSAEIDQLFTSTMQELGIPVPDSETAERCLLHHLAARLSAGAISPREAAAWVWQGIVPLTEPERAFVHAAGEEYYLDILPPEELLAWENDIRIAARALAGAAFPCPQ